MRTFTKSLVLKLLLVSLLQIIPAYSLASDDAEGATPSTLPTLFLRVGQKYPLEGIPIQSLEISPKNLATAHQTPEGLLLVGTTAGSGTLKIQSGEKTVEAKIIVQGNAQPSQPVSSAFSELKKLPGIQFSKLGQKTVLQGEVLGRAAYQRLLRLSKEDRKGTLLLATPAPGVKESLIEQASARFKNRGLESLTIESAGNRFFLEGNVSTPGELEIALELAQSIIPNIENHVPIPFRIDPTISVRIFLVELSRQAHRVLGLSWPSSLSQVLKLDPSHVFFGPSWVANLNHLSSNGNAKILAEPLLAVKAGASAELSAGGQIPIRIFGKHESKVEWKHYGLKVKIHIAGVAGRRIRARIETEASHLDEATMIEGIPGLRSNHMNTEVDALEGQPILLTGLFQSSVSKDVEKIPLLGDIPLLGELFKSRSFREHESELLVALLPRFGETQAKLPLTSARGLEFDASWRPLD